MKEVILYSGEFCGDCQKMKKFLSDNNIKYELRDIRENENYAKELEEKTGKLGVPYLIIDGKWQIGYEKGVGFTEEWARNLFGIN